MSPSPPNIFTRSDPLVFWLLPECLPPDCGPKEVLALTGLKRREILLRVLGDGSKALLKFVGKINNFNYDPSDFEMLCLLFGNSEWTVLRHIRKVEWSILKLFARERQWFEHRGVQRLLHEDNEAMVLRTFQAWRRLSEDIRRLARVMRVAAPSPRLKNIQSFAELKHFHDALAEQLNQRRKTEIEARYKKPFPLAPFSGNQDIQPINSIGDLLDEGVVMHHCVGSYVERILENRCYIFKVLAPERATLEILRTPDGKYRIGQLKRACNARPSAETATRVRQWFETWNTKKRR